MTPKEIVDQMMRQDRFSQWLGIEVLRADFGVSMLRMSVRPEMVNGFGVAHGGITFSLADSAFAFACNSQGRHTVSIHCTVEHLAPVEVGDILIATAEEDALGKTISNYAIKIVNQHDQLVAAFRGVAYRKRQIWE